MVRKAGARNRLHENYPSSLAANEESIKTIENEN